MPLMERWMLRCWTLARVMQDPPGIANTVELIKQGLESSGFQ